MTTISRVLSDYGPLSNRFRHKTTKFEAQKPYSPAVSLSRNGVNHSGPMDRVGIGAVFRLFDKFDSLRISLPDSYYFMKRLVYLIDDDGDGQ